MLGLSTPRLVERSMLLLPSPSSFEVVEVASPSYKQPMKVEAQTAPAQYLSNPHVDPLVVRND